MLRICCYLCGALLYAVMCCYHTDAAMHSDVFKTYLTIKTLCLTICRLVMVCHVLLVEEVVACSVLLLFDRLLQLSVKVMVVMNVGR